MARKTFFTFSLIMICLMMYGMTEALAPSNYQDANAGSMDNPFIIANLSNLRWLSENPKYWGDGYGTEYPDLVTVQKFYFLQTADIDASETENWNNGAGFSPIGSESKEEYFWSEYDGQGFKIENLFINDTNETNVGLFGIVINSKLSNVNLVNTLINSGLITGALVGSAILSEISNSSTSGIINGITTEALIGGLVGNTISTQIDRCFSTVSIVGQDLITHSQMGGLVAALQEQSSVSNSYFMGEMSGISLISGGLVSGSRNSFIGNSFVASNRLLENSSNFLHYAMNSTLSNNFWDYEFSHHAEGISVLIGNNVINDCFALTTIEMKRATTFINKGWDFDNLWNISSDINDSYPHLR